MKELNVIQELYNNYSQKPLPKGVGAVLESELGISFAAKYVDIPLDNPLLVAPGQMTLRVEQIRSIEGAGFAGCVLKSVVGEDESGLCSMHMQRKKPTYIRSFYEDYDTRREFPIIHWDGRCDVRALPEYLVFAQEARALDRPGFAVIASLLCHLPLPGEDINPEEWLHATRALYSLGYKHIEIDFCPFLSGDNYTEDQKNVLRWYKECTALMKSVSADIKVIPKLLSLDWGPEFGLEMAAAAQEGGADAVVVANRMFKPEHNSGHGGEELRAANLGLTSLIKRTFPTLQISATGGVYTGRAAYEYLKAGADSVQVLSFIMGKVNVPFEKEGSKVDKVLHKLLLHPETGLARAMLDEHLIGGKDG